MVGWRVEGGECRVYLQFRAALSISCLFNHCDFYTARLFALLQARECCPNTPVMYVLKIFFMSCPRWYQIVVMVVVVTSA